MLQKLAEVRKFAVVVVGIVAAVLAAGVLSGDAAEWARLVIAVGTALGVYAVPNADPAEPVDHVI